MANVTLDQQILSGNLLKAMNEELTKVAEPVIQKALKEVEIELRRRLAVMVISQLESGYSAYRNGMDLHIVVHNKPTKE